jgi:hypothetical protein
LAGVLGEALEDLESTELPQDEVSSLKIELVPPGGFKTLKIIFNIINNFGKKIDSSVFSSNKKLI